MSNVSVPEHMAKRNPPPTTYARMASATANFRWLTLANPSARASRSASCCCCWYHACPRCEA